ncbi:MAG TPA: PAS domain-containing sensor histidine kinase, partial [Fibrella sp.]
MSLPATTPGFTFLKGGGEMGQLTRSYDWSRTPLGPPDTWPQSLRTTLGILLNSKCPMALFWGEELICFYNDAYRLSFGKGGKQSLVPGRPGAAAWPETWPVMKPLIDQVLAGSEVTWNEDQLVPVYPNGAHDDVYGTFSFSPVSDESGNPAGVFVTCIATTGRGHTINQLKTSEQLLQNLVRDASIGIIVLRGEDMMVSIVNDAYARLIDRQFNELQDKPLFSIIPESEAVFRPIIDGVRLTGEPLYLYDQPYFVYVDGTKKDGFLNLVYQPYREQDG